jgi:hypothetical protein
MTITAGPLAIGAGDYSWINAPIYITDSSTAVVQYSVTAVSNCGDTVDQTQCTTLTLNSSPASGAATWTTEGMAYSNGAVSFNTTTIKSLGGTGVTTTKTAGGCTFTIKNGIITGVSGC